MSGLRVTVLVAVLLLSTAGAIVIPRRAKWMPPLWAVLLLGLAVRVVVAILAQPATPQDAAVFFGDAGGALLHGHHPALRLPGHEWNFLPVKPYLSAALLGHGPQALAPI
jgi:hypothetical protein